MKLIAVDPGYERIGIAVLERDAKKKETLIYSECFKTSAKLSFAQRLKAIGEEIARVVKEYKPDALAIEKLYFTKNQTTAMGVAEARGVIIYETARQCIPVHEYTPMEIKVAVAGHGKASKDDVLAMTQKLIKLPEERKYVDDEIDAIAIGLTCFARERFK